MDTQTKYYHGMDGNPVKSPVAFCHFSKHCGYMTSNMVKLHKCLSRECTRLQKLDCPYWADRKKRKQLAKKAKKRLWEKAL